MARFVMNVSFQVVYHAEADEDVQRTRATALAETMLAVLRGSPKVKTLGIELDEVESVDSAE